jgi:hypothetical protein
MKIINTTLAILISGTSGVNTNGMTIIRITPFGV